MNIKGKKICDNCFSPCKKEPCEICGYKKSNYRPEIGILPVGTVLKHRYSIGCVLGKGGFGVTYKAYDMKNERVVAIKEYYPNGIAHRDTGTTGVSVTDASHNDTFKMGADKFFEEAKTVSRFNGNPNIVSVYEFFFENNTVYYVMEFLEGMDLKAYIRKNGGKISEGCVMSILNVITDALLITHSMNVLHRDISPDNIYVENNGGIKLIDFGAARLVVSEQSKSLSVILKQGFAPLEQYQRKGKQGPWTDIYALGATCYYALTGKTLDDATERIDEPSIGTAEEFGIDGQLWSIMEKCLAVKAADRYQSVVELKADLSKVTIAVKPLIAAEENDIPLTVMSEPQNTMAETGNIPGTVAVSNVDSIPGTVAVSNADSIPGTVAVSNADSIPGTVAVSENDITNDSKGDADKKKKAILPIVNFIKSKKGIISIASFVGVVIIIIAVTLIAAGTKKNRPVGNDGGNNQVAEKTEPSGEGNTVDIAEGGTSEEDGTSKEDGTDKEDKPEKKTDASESEAEGSSENVTRSPIENQTEKPTEAPTQKPTEAPTEKPTQKPTEAPTQKPTEKPTEKPTVKPTEAPTTAPETYVTARECTVYAGSGSSTTAYSNYGKYTGDWKNGKPNGNGYFISTSNNGDFIYYTIIKGSWSNGYLTGKGSHVSGNCFSYKTVPTVNTTDWSKYVEGTYENHECVTIYKGTWNNGVIVGESTRYYQLFYKGSSYTLNGELVTTPDRIEAKYNTTDWVTNTGVIPILQGAEWDYKLSL